jgi:hypothetical protein
VGRQLELAERRGRAAERLGQVLLHLDPQPPASGMAPAVADDEAATEREGDGRLTAHLERASGGSGEGVREAGHHPGDVEREQDAQRSRPPEPGRRD